MKKSLLALAVAAALPVAAQAQSSVTLYGVIDVGAEWSNDAANATPSALNSALSNTARGNVTAAAQAAGPEIAGKSVVRLNSGGWTSSRIGVRGAEPLGKTGMTAIFNIEHRFQLDTGAIQVGQAVATPPYTALQAGSFWNGIASAGLRGGFGEVTAGRQYTPAFFSYFTPDFTANSGYNNWAAPTVPASTGTSSSGAQGVSALYGLIRADNSVMWTSPAMSGLIVRVMHAPGAAAYNSTEISNPAAILRANGSGDLTAVSGVWTQGKMMATGSYSKVDNQTGIGNSWTLSGRYDFGKFGLLLGKSELKFMSSGVNTYTIESTSLGAYASVGAAGRVLLNAHQMDMSNLGSGIQIGLSYIQNLSNRTHLYVAYGKNDFSEYKPTVATSDVGYESNKQRVTLGLRHNF